MVHAAEPGVSLPSCHFAYRPIREVMPEQRKLDDALTVDALDASNRMLFSAMPFNLVAVVFVVVVLGTSVSWARRLTWAGLMLAVVLFGLAVALAYQRRRNEGPVLYWRWGVVASACAGVGWAALVLIAFPPASEGAFRAFILVLMLGVSSVSLMSTASSRGRFAAFNLPLMATLTAVYIGSSDHATRMLGMAIPLYAVVMTVMNAQIHDIVTTNMRLKHELRDAAMIDPLTGLLNRRAFAGALDAAVSQARRSREVIGVLYLDVDNFKVINDRHGHDAGDRALVEVGARLRGVLRTGDSCGRLGGDEFAVVARGLDDEGAIAEIAQRVIAALDEPVNLGGDRLTVSASIGGSVIRDDSDAASLLSEADTAQYRAKRAGGRRAVTYKGRYAASVAANSETS
jgi:diguanylate cyclase (GGDEF)-like protein